MRSPFLFFKRIGHSLSDPTLFHSKYRNPLLESIFVFFVVFFKCFNPITPLNPFPEVIHKPENIIHTLMFSFIFSLSYLLVNTSFNTKSYERLLGVRIFKYALSAVLMTVLILFLYLLYTATFVGVNAITKSEIILLTSYTVLNNIYLQFLIILFNFYPSKTKVNYSANIRFNGFENSPVKDGLKATTTLSANENEKSESSSYKITILGKNRDEVKQINSIDFIYAKSEGHYVKVFYRNDESKSISFFVIRNTIKNLLVMTQTVPQIRRIHKSYLVHFDHVKDVNLSPKNMHLKLKTGGVVLPISKVYFENANVILNN